MKVSKASVDYSKGHPGSKCSLCTHFFRGAQGKQGTCELVAGSIDPDYWCEKFKKR